MNNTQLKIFLDSDDLRNIRQGSSWISKCFNQILDGVNKNVTEIAGGIVAQRGSKPVELVNNTWNAWGVDIETCYANCSREKFPMVCLSPLLKII
jgi:hypothetical protein